MANPIQGRLVTVIHFLCDETKHLALSGGICQLAMIISRTVLLLIPLFTLSSTGAGQTQETWETGYQGKDAQGAHVLGYWKFDGNSPLEDSSSKGNRLELSGATSGAEGRFGQGLECGYSLTQAHSAKVPGKQISTPSGAFTLEMWVKPNEKLAQTSRCYLIDKKYTDSNHSDFSWMLVKQDRTVPHRMFFTLGFGGSTETFFSDPLNLPTEEWHHLAVTYDAKGTVTFYQDGSLINQITKPGLGAIRAGTNPLHIGDRMGSNFGGFPGILDEVRLSEGALKFEGMSMEILAPRHVWQRLEKPEPILIRCTNLRRESTSGAKLTASLDQKTETYPLPALAPGESHDSQFVVDTNLKPAVYQLEARLEDGRTKIDKRSHQEIVARPAPSMPVIMWGKGDLPRMKDIGFTHYMGMSVSNLTEAWNKRHNEGEIPPAAAPDDISASRQELDDALSAGMNIIARVSPKKIILEMPEMVRVDRAGKPFPRPDIIAVHPEIPPYYEKVGRSLGTTYGSHPALAATLVDSEVRDNSRPSFSAVDIAAYKKFSGQDIPAEVLDRGGVLWTNIKNFPVDRVIPDDDPILKYYRWFWTAGDGWNGLHSALSRGVKSTSRKEHWTFFDPAVRQPSISGSGGDVDVLSHWTYTYPDPQRIGMATDQMLAMAEASGKGQKVMKMTQIIWYRNQTAPITDTRPEDPVPWIDQDPDAAYITIAPMHLKEAFWTKISRPITGIMYHGWQSLVPTTSTSTYKYTNPNTVHVLKELIHEVILPLGPTLMNLPDQSGEVAFLESFTSQMFARRGGHGSNIGWSADVWMALQHAHVRTDILFEETLLKKGLAGRKILVMPDCDVLTASVVKLIREWQQNGGKIIADEKLCPALKADVVLTTYKRTRKIADDRAHLLALAAELQPQVAALGYAPEVTADSPEVILRMRRSGDARYLFAINDRRKAGTYVGQSGLVQENGLPTRTIVTLANDAGAIYDLTSGHLITPQQTATGTLTWPVDLGPCDGRIFMILPKPLAEPSTRVPATVKRGMTADLEVKLGSAPGTAVDAVLPVEVRIRDANGREAEGSGYHATKNGILSLPLSIAPNEDPGVWEIRVTALGARTESTCYMTVVP